MANQLINETSPYLQQHANNPVDWYTWGETALAKAKQEHKPILLSIGYSACHWCHVMAHESFEDPETATLMNQCFVNIKVDREERPDLDKIYQLAHQLLNYRAGGWPLTIFLDHKSQVPFFSGTYFPLQAQYGMPSFKQVLIRVATLYEQEYETIQQQNSSITDALCDINIDKKAENPFTEIPVELGLTMLEQQFDHDNGGFGSAPKFPQSSSLQFLLHLSTANNTQDKERNLALNMLEKSLTKIAQGGIYDHIAGGFSRYSVDAEWQIPHFEKMLYDNAQLLSVYANSYHATNISLFKTIGEETANWIIQYMQSPEGGYYASLDADSEGQEGKYYVWDKEYINELLTSSEYLIFREHYGLNFPANLEGKWHLRVTHCLEDIAEKNKISITDAEALLLSARNKLKVQRQLRIPPHCDKKILTSWNALMIKAMLHAAVAFSEQRYLQSALRAITFIQQNMLQEQRLLATYKDGRAHLPAYLDDYAFLCDALITLLETQWDTAILDSTITLAETMKKYFYDNENGGFYFTANDHESLIQRPKSWQDEALPAGNAIAASVFFKLGYLLGKNDYLAIAEKTLQACWERMNKYSYVHTGMLIALQTYFNPPEIIIIRGEEPEIQNWQQHYRKQAHANQLCFAIPDCAKNLPEAIASKAVLDTTVAYICLGQQCLAPVTELSI